ncbi:MAG TPA: ABC transporter substrate-binding protein [Candidatus Acidoferrales bacterium]|jgi:NitT/TauT family transport system substrate-binding protein|nr:ABC transporter substrate-binding protein [Candidatus Acidoferrales bacterium]
MPDASRRLLVAYVPVLAAATTMIAADRGYFADAGLDVELVTINTAQDAIALLARRRLDAAVGGISAAFFNAVRRGFNVRLAGCVCYMPKAGHPTALMIRTDKYEGGILIPQQLRGEKIGVIGGLGTASSYYVGEMIRPLTFADVDLVPLNSADQGIALARKSIAAALVWNPFTQAYERKNIAKISAIPTPGTGTSGLFFGERLLENRPLANALFDAYDRATIEISGKNYYDPKNVKIYSKHIGSPESVFLKDDRYAYEPGMPVDRKTVERMQQLFIGEKTLAYREPVADSQLIWNRR